MKSKNDEGKDEVMGWKEIEGGRRRKEESKDEGMQRKRWNYKVKHRNTG